MVTLGIDRIGDFPSLLKGKKIGLITNYSGVTSNLDDDMTAFTSQGYTVTKLFTPEHGLYGAMDGAAVGNSEHPKFHVPIISLYGNKTEPSEEDLDGVDLLVYDIQDVGLRYYTYIYTLANCMKAADRIQMPFLILDRPDPLGGEAMGSRISQEIHTFVGDHGLTIRYGMTPAELGYYLKDYLHLSLNLMALPMEGYRRSMKWPQTGQLWNLPSPSIHTFQSVLCYYGGCFFEATNISEGRGTAEPFQIYGAPFIDMDKLVSLLKERIRIPYLAFRTRAFTPFWSKHQSKTCFGVEFIPTSDELDFMPAALITMKTIKDLYPDQFELKSYADVSRLTSLSGDQRVEDYLNDRIELRDLMDSWTSEAKAFQKETEKYRIYG